MNIVKGAESHRVAKGFVGKMTVRQHVNQENKRWKIYVEIVFKGNKEATPALMEVGPHAVKKDCQTGYVEVFWTSTRFLFKEKTAVPQPRTGTNKLFAILTLRSVTFLYEIKTDASGSMWLVAPVSATIDLDAPLRTQIKVLQRDWIAVRRDWGREMHVVEEVARNGVETT